LLDQGTCGFQNEAAKVKQENAHDSNAMQQLIFSRTMRVGSILVSGLFVALAIVSLVSGRETVGAVATAVITLVATVMLWMRHRYTAYAWAFLAAAMGVGMAMVERVWVPEPFSWDHILSYWGWKLGGTLIMFWCAFLLFRLGKRITDHGV
jgi:hypothetical protein